jgi:hypothetical protein
MANTYTQIYIQLVFAPYARMSLIPTKRRSFRQEYLTLLRKFRVEYDDRYLFEWPQ